MSEHMMPIPSRIYNASVGGHVAGADQIIDDETGLTLDKVTGGALEEKTYTSGSDNGMGRVVLRKNLVEGVNTLTQSMINKSNTIYIIQYDFTLGENVTVPANCVLEFDGGYINGSHSITLQNTLIDGTVKIGAGVLFNGICANQVVFSKIFDNDDSLLSFINNVGGFNKLVLENKTYSFNTEITLSHIRESLVINGNNAIIKRASADSDATLALLVKETSMKELYIENLIFDGSFTEEVLRNDSAVVTRVVYIDSCDNVRLKNVTIQNTNAQTYGYEVDNPSRNGLLLVTNYDSCHVDNLRIDRAGCNGECTTFFPKNYDSNSTARLLLENSYFNGKYWSPCNVWGQATIRNNKVDYSSGSVFNLFGDDCFVEENIIYGNKKSWIVDFGEHNDETAHNLPKNCVVRNNIVIDSGGNFVNAYRGENIVIDGNTFTGAFIEEQSTLARIVEFAGGKNIRITNNTFEGIVRFANSAQYSDEVNGITITGNTFSFIPKSSNPNNSKSSGINFYNGVSNAIISGNIIKAVPDNAFITIPARGNTIKNISILNNNFDGRCVLLEDHLLISDERLTGINTYINMAIFNNSNVLSVSELLIRIIVGAGQSSVTTDMYIPSLPLKYIHPKRGSYESLSSLISLGGFDAAVGNNLDGNIVVYGTAAYSVVEDGSAITIDADKVIAIGNKGLFYPIDSGTIDSGNIGTIQRYDLITVDGVRLIVLKNTLSNSQKKINLKKIDDRGGTTRPTGENLYVGASYFDTSLGYNIWYNGTAWVNATGTPV